MLPLREHCIILSFVVVYLSLILKFGKLGGSFLKHLLLEVSPLNSIFLIHLLKDIHLVILSSSGLLGSSSLVLSRLLGDGSFNLSLLVLLEPLSFSLLVLLQEDVLLSRSIDILQKVDFGLLFSLPNSILHLILPLSLLLDELINKLLILSLVIL